jgi:hypothetical protein
VYNALTGKHSTEADLIEAESTDAESTEAES